MTLESAVAHLAAMEAQRTRALELVRVVAETHEQALGAYNEAAKVRDEALWALIEAAQSEPENKTALLDAIAEVEGLGKTVKRPAVLADELRDLDDVGGH